jgi:NADPH:quinone reductase-like Zn-dependent oxidoreductase
MGLVNGGYAEFVVAPAENWAKLPQGLRSDDAGAFPLVLLTGDQLVDATLGSAHGGGKGLTVLVTGAVGAVGRVAVWCAKQRGCIVLAGVRAKQREDAKNLGADGVVALDDEAAVERLPMLDRIADTVSGETIARLLAKLKPGGILGSAQGEPPSAKERGIKVNAFHTHPDSARLAELAAAVVAGKFVVPIAQRFPLTEAAAAHGLAERGGVGKVLLIP